MTTTNAGKTNPRQSNLRTTIEIKMTRTKTAPIKKMVIRAFVLVALASCLWVVSPTLAAWAQAQPPAQAPDQSTQDQSQQGQAKQDQAGAAKSSATEKPAQAASREHQPTSIAGELAKETRESEGEQEEHADLKHSTMVQKLAKLTGLSVHGAHIFALDHQFRHHRNRTDLGNPQE